MGWTRKPRASSTIFIWSGRWHATSPGIETCDNFSVRSTLIHFEAEWNSCLIQFMKCRFCFPPEARSQSSWIYQTISIFGFIERYNSDQMCRFAVKMPSRLCSIVSNLPITLLLSFLLATPLASSSKSIFCCSVFEQLVRSMGSSDDLVKGAETILKTSPLLDDISSKPRHDLCLVVCASPRSRCRCHWSYLKIN